jgi:hypothetical protein
MRGIVLVVLLLGCTQTPQEKAQDVCQAFCQCTDPGGLPSIVDKCVIDQCLPQLPTVADPCLDCVFAHDQVCPDLFDQCTDLCFSTTGGMP